MNKDTVFHKGTRLFLFDEITETDSGKVYITTYTGATLLRGKYSGMENCTVVGMAHKDGNNYIVFDDSGAMICNSSFQELFDIE